MPALIGLLLVIILIIGLAFHWELIAVSVAVGFAIGVVAEFVKAGKNAR